MHKTSYFYLSKITLQYAQKQTMIAIVLVERGIGMRKLMKWIFILGILFGLGYAGYHAYHYAVDAIIMRVRNDVKKTIFGVINPLRWPRKIFG